MSSGGCKSRGKRESWKRVLVCVLFGESTGGFFFSFLLLCFSFFSVSLDGLIEEIGARAEVVCYFC